ncbi:MAG: hypothetical protein COT18_02010 [Elusimicrobia bacterium CG08_land_8_20_14_0_20_59_10]|nr:MAG: hypothetical protein COT18_02010 [Elusimicrobia bacterium CG08_land_8_20_14_0_20_59_10]
MNIETVKTQLKSLHLSAAAREVEEVLASHGAAVDLGWVAELLERELDARRERAVTRRIENAEFPEIKTIEGFDWGFNRKLDRAAIDELSDLELIKRRGIALFLGQTGTGKTHLALGLGLKAAKEGLRVYCTSVKKLIAEIEFARARNTLVSLFRRILSAQLWIIDDWGVVSMSREVSEEVFDLLDRRKLNSAMILTSNRDIEEWGEVFADPVLASAAIDRMFEAAKIVIFQGKSYRLKDRIVLPDLRLDNIPPKRGVPEAGERGECANEKDVRKLQRRKG